MKSSKILVEKFERRPGIYIIFNTKGTKNNKYKVYIGKAKDLKERMVQHVRNLFANKDNNPELQAEFNNGENEYRIGLLEYVDAQCLEEVKKRLDEYERIYYATAVELFGKENVYNKVELNGKEKSDSAEISIKEALDRKKQLDGVNILEKKKDLQDWLDKTTDEIKSSVRKLLKKNSVGDKVDINFENISVKELYDNNELDFIMFGKMGDYVGKEDRNQTFTEILTEKLADIACYGKCLWITAGPTIDNTQWWYRRVNNANEKKMYAIFSLTIYKYGNNPNGIETKECEYYYWEDKDGKKYYATGNLSDREKKALVINRLWAVEEDFIRTDFEELYYYAQRKIGMLSTELRDLKRQVLFNAFSKKSILKNEEIRKTLNLEGELFERFKRERSCSDFPASSEDRDKNSTVYYILAEVSDYVYVKPVKDTNNQEFIRYKKCHPFLDE